ncbi:MAG: putative quinol monooxygenase [Bacillota bacterium]|nr:putative quinol monooxygenase [Bacillota bacterium]
MIVIHAFIKVNPEKRDEFLEAANLVMEGSKAEEGNISYHLYEDTKESNAFVMVEEWKDLDAVRFHGGTPHYLTFGSMSKGLLLEAPRVERYEIAKKL